jgi:hypothetical protein
MRRSKCEKLLRVYVCGVEREHRPADFVNDGPVALICGLVRLIE